jgi:hypothetical protein
MVSASLDRERRVIVDIGCGIMAFAARRSALFVPT